jgi:hypothetical protein
LLTNRKENTGEPLVMHHSMLLIVLSPRGYQVMK